MKNIKVIGFDADDTLWVNEPNYVEVEKSFCKLFESYLPEKEISSQLFKVEMQNLEMYGYGAKGFVLSMIETALKITGAKTPPEKIEAILNLGKSLLNRPVELLDDIGNLLQHLKKNYRVMVVTKGDLLDQQRKLEKSGLLPYFDQVEIMSDKKQSDYSNLLKRIDIRSDEFLMVGNSVKSDIRPVLAIGAHAVFVPYHTSWQHEREEEPATAERYHKMSKLSELLTILPG